MSRIIKDVIFSLIVAACTAGILAAGVGTIATMLGWIEGNEVILQLYLIIAVPLFLLSFILMTRSNRKEAKNDP